MIPNYLVSRFCNCITRVHKRFAGHSKWANIKHTKAEKDGQRSMLFLKLGQRIKVAIQEGGSAKVETNFHLAQAVEVAKKNCMPIATIQNYIKSFEADKTKADVVWYEVRGPKGSHLIISTLTDNYTKTKNIIASIIRKHRAVFSERSAKHMFDHKAVITAKPPADSKNPNEETVDHAIECGAEEVLPSEIEENHFDFICELNQINHVKGKLLQMNYEIKKADFDFIPTMRVSLNENEMEEMSKLVDKLTALPEVIKIYDNIL